MLRYLAAAAALLTFPALASAQDPALTAISDSGDTAWILTASALVLMMTLPGLGLFYGGLVRAKNVLSVLLQCGAIAAIASVLWVIVGYTLAFGQVSNGWLGAGNAWMLLDLGMLREGTTMPESAFVLFQMTFAVITPALTGRRMGGSRPLRLGSRLLRALEPDRLRTGRALGLGRWLACI